MICSFMLQLESQWPQIQQLSIIILKMKVVISGAGICGLTLAITAKKAGLVPIVIQKSANVYAHTFGGGIGLWPPSQMVYEQLGLLQKLKEVSGLMPNPCYLNEKGWKLGQPSSSFHQKYKISCLERQSLSRILYQQCQNLGIQVRTGVSVMDAQSAKDIVNIELSTGQKIQANVLIGADGINSNVRNIIMRQRKLPEIKPSHCGYAYFRAVIDLSQSSQYSSSDKWHKVAFESWGQEKRFGYVPLKQPKTFWFFAVPLGTDGLSQYIGSHTCSEQQKKWILKQIGHWKGPISIKSLVQMTPANFILRTDIRKIKGVERFPWNNKHNNILIVGDSANATAPNIAQGAGLAIESAWDLISMVNFENGVGIDSFLQRRKSRATTVQDTADLIAKIGQISRPISNIRDIFMASATKFLPSVQQKIFESAVRYSLGGSSNSPHWIPALNKSDQFQGKYNGNVLKQAVGEIEFSKLPEVTKRFRSSFIGSGQGHVTVKSGLLGKLFGLPPAMENERFEAFVDVNVDNKAYFPTQKWTRIFGAGSQKAIKYATIHHATPDFNAVAKTGLTLTESIGDDILRKNIKFGYEVTLDKEVARYKSNSLWLWNNRLPIPSIFLPKSSWFERQTENGWQFDGKLSLPLAFGGIKFFEYKGRFTPDIFYQKTGQQVVIAGGTGFIGSAVARQFHSKGWHVIILSRKSQNIPTLPFAKVVQWNPSAANEVRQRQIERLANLFAGSNLVINLAGENPGASRWDDKTKDKILNSRLTSIQLIANALQKSSNKQIKYIQASAAGFYGNRGDQILTDDTKQGPSNTFRVNTCVSLEKSTHTFRPTAIIARIGHVFGHSDGIFPFLRLSSQLRTKKFDKGGQYIPWIHVQDVANAFYFMAINPQKFQGKFTNIVAPEHQTYDSLYRTMGQINKRGCYFTIPSKILTFVMGELSSVILQSQRMHPERLLSEGFKFRYEKLNNALLSRQLL